jgi:hypothetical protein
LILNLNPLEIKISNVAIQNNVTAEISIMYPAKPVELKFE